MKRILIVLLSIFLINCNAIGGGDYEIKGKISNNSSSAIFLERLSHAEMKIVDSSIISAGGDFKLKSVIDETGFYRLRLKNTGQGEIFWFLTLGVGEKVNAKLDAKNLAVFEITGNEEQKEFQDLLRNFGQQQGEIGSLYQQYQALSQKSPESKELAEMTKVIQSKNDNFQQYLTKVIQTSKGYITKYYLYSVMLQQYQQGTEIPEQLTTDVRLFTEKMSKERPSSVYTKDFLNIVRGFDAYKEQAAAKAKLSPGALAPDIDLAKEDGSKVKLSSFKGKVVLMDFWASWCRPCRNENPNVIRAYNKYKDKGFVVASISTDTDMARWKAAIQQDGMNWTTHYADVLTGNTGAKIYEVSYIPKTYLIGRDGKIVAKDIRGEALDQELQKLFK